MGSRRVRIKGVEREFDPKRYAAVVIALARHLTAQTEDHEAAAAPETEGAADETEAAYDHR